MWMKLWKKAVAKLEKHYESIKKWAIKLWSIASIALVLASCWSPKTEKELREDLKETKQELRMEEQELSENIAEYDALKKNDAYYNDEANRVNKLLKGKLSAEQIDNLENQLEIILEKLKNIEEESDKNEKEKREIIEEINKLKSKIAELEKQTGNTTWWTTPQIPPKRKFQ